MTTDSSVSNPDRDELVPAGWRLVTMDGVEDSVSTPSSVVPCDNLTSQDYCKAECPGDSRDSIWLEPSLFFRRRLRVRHGADGEHAWKMLGNPGDLSSLSVEQWGKSSRFRQPRDTVGTIVILRAR